MIGLLSGEVVIYCGNVVFISYNMRYERVALVVNAIGKSMALVGLSACQGRASIAQSYLLRCLLGLYAPIPRCPSLVAREYLL